MVNLSTEEKHKEVWNSIITLTHPEGIFKLYCHLGFGQKKSWLENPLNSLYKAWQCNRLLLDGSETEYDTCRKPAFNSNTY